LGIGDWAQSPIPNPQSPIPNPQSPYINNTYYLNDKINLKKLIKIIILKEILFINIYKLKFIKFCNIFNLIILFIFSFKIIIKFENSILSFIISSELIISDFSIDENIN
jgi:hypothetical protein